MKTRAKSLAALAALILPLGAAGGESYFIPKIHLAEPAVEVPVINFAIPTYLLAPHEREIVAACLVLEAASQGPVGMRGVMAVIRNRSRGLPELFAATVLKEKQFSALNALSSGRESWAHTVQRAQRDPTWNRALALVDAAVADSWWDPTQGATHYTRSGEQTRWTGSLAKTVTIGAHSFYR